MAFGAHAGRIGQLRGAVIKADLPRRQARSPRSDAAPEPRIARIPARARRAIVQAPVRLDSGRVDVIVQLQVIILNLPIEGHVRTTYERLLRLQAFHFRACVHQHSLSRSLTRDAPCKWMGSKGRWADYVKGLSRTPVIEDRRGSNVDNEKLAPPKAYRCRTLATSSTAQRNSIEPFS
jgi:hypothetical protein